MSLEKLEEEHRQRIRESIGCVIKRGYNVNQGDTPYNSTWLHKAAGIGDTEYVQKLLDVSADVEARDVFQQTPIFETLHGDDNPVLAQLILAGANPNVLDHLTESPLCKALMNNQEQAAKTLVTAGADLDYALSNEKVMRLVKPELVETLKALPKPTLQVMCALSKAKRGREWA